MKTKLLSIAIGALSLFSIRSTAQTYSFSQLTSPYADITGGTIVTTSGWDYFTIIDTQLPFTFNFFGNVEDSLYILSGFAAFHQVGAGNFPIDQIYSFDAELIERSTGGPSHISIVTTGTTPNRIHKVQTKNAGYDSDGTGTESANVQLWLYESSNVVEIHYGASNGSSSTYAPLQGPTVGIYKDQTAFVALSGSASNPSASSSAASLNVNGNPPSGMVYRFAPVAAGIKQFGNNAAGMIYPNPSNGIINFKSSVDITNGTLKVINAIGQVVYEKNEFTISKDQTQKLDLSLETGLYYLQISSKGQNFSPEKLIVK